MTSITVTAPAKVNLFLKVLSKRADGYHNILTLFERISLADTIKISKIPNGITIKSDVLITKNLEHNLVYKAAKLILGRGKIKLGVKIEIEKKIPIAAGLGGGSSDAAATLIGIKKLFCLRLSGKTLKGMARSLGADVPFFMLGANFAIGRGRGDELKAIRSKNRFWHLIIKAGNKTATRDIYEAFDEIPNCLTPRPESVKIRIPSKLRMDYTHIESILHNDLERVVLSKKGVISSISKGLAQLLGKRAIVSGSGPSLFCLYRTRKEAVKAREIVLRGLSARQRRGWQVFVA
ncbi:MAG: 4-(cytidine 5'-diphospho)-2-C-methyl-D-erythritol kinase [Candidatus Omnitrophota bacterium]|nr:4-(cytidine 5'-diphospho)-2-C-methyl-D-erythritol kinase [Candidatus Omnitrophota bacterium]